MSTVLPTVLYDLRLCHLLFDFREMVPLFLLIFAFQNGLPTGQADLHRIVNSLQLTVIDMNGKIAHLENEVKVRVVLVLLKLEHFFL